MSFVVKNGFVSLNSVDRSALCEAWEPSWELETQESRPFSQPAVRKDGGLNNNSFTVTVVDDESFTFTQWLNDNQGTKVPFALRYDGAAISATNPEWTGTCIVPPMAPPANQGELVRYTVTFPVDGSVAMAIA